MQTLWKIMDGKKTISGIVLLLVGLYASKYISQDDATLLIDTAFQIFGCILTIIGLFHKVKKAYETEE